MSRKRRKSSKGWRTRRFYIYSTLTILVISAVAFGLWMFVFRDDGPDHVTVDRAWLEENIWRVESYKEKSNGLYDTYLLEVQPGDEDTWEKLCYNFTYTPYTALNSYYLANGVNCQGMTVHLADWCERHGYEYSVAWTRTHTSIYIRYDAQWYLFNFDQANREIKEVSGADVQKGMITQ